MAITKNLNIDQGATFSTNVYYLDIKTPTSLAGYGVRAKLKRSYYSANSTSFIARVIDAANGIVSLRLNSDVTANLVAGRYVYDVEAYKTTLASTLSSSFLPAPANRYDYITATPQLIFDNNTPSLSNTYLSFNLATDTLLVLVNGIIISPGANVADEGALEQGDYYLTSNAVVLYLPSFEGDIVSILSFAGAPSFADPQGITNSVIRITEGLVTVNPGVS
jgi:hypothetical protein